MSAKKVIKKYPVIGGVYHHYKGGNYQVISMAKHSETQEDLVLYKSIEFGSFHARPLSMWFDKVKVFRIKLNRFQLIKE